MLLCIDIGNSNIVLGCYKNSKLEFISRIATAAGRTSDQYAVEINSIFELYHINESEITGSIISSVVPILTGSVRDAVKTVIGLDSEILTHKTDSGLIIKLDDPSVIGSDFIAAAVGAMEKYPLPAVIINMGTATTFSAVNEKGEFLGGAIVAGLRTSTNALLEHTSLLQAFSFEAPAATIGPNTPDALRSGAIFGTAAMIDGMCARFIAELGKKASCVATGGLAPYIIPYCKTDIAHDDMLLLDGLRGIYERILRGRKQ